MRNVIKLVMAASYLVVYCGVVYVRGRICSTLTASTTCLNISDY